MNSSAERVAARFLSAAKRPMKPEKLQELMMKLRKSAWGSNKMEVISQVFDALGGWTIEPMYYLEAAHTANYSKAEHSWYSSENPKNVEAVWEEKKREEVTHLPSAQSLSKSDLYKTWTMDVGDITTTPRGFTGFPYKEWRCQEGARLRAPNGKTFEAKSISPNDYVSNIWSLDKKRLTDWLKKESPFFDQMNEKLGLDSYEVEREKRKSLPRTRANTGTCPCCFANIKLTPRARHGKDKTLPGMVLHGYQRPGLGYVLGNCFGQDWPPFELSSEGTQVYVGMLEDRLQKNEAYLKRLTSGEVVSLADARGNRIEKSEVEARVWEKRLDDEVEKMKSQILWLGKDISRMKRLIAAWKPEPLPEEGQEIVPR